MAPSKKPTYKVDTTLRTDRRRRKSDLVIMWQCVWDVTSLLLHEFWVIVLRIWEFLVSELWFSSNERFQVIAWLDKFLPCAPEDFSDSWRDGRLLAILLNRLQPGCFPDAIRLDPDYGLQNVYKAFTVLETYFGITPNVSVEEIVTCAGDSDAKLFDVLRQLKRLNEAEPEIENITPEPDLKENNVQAFVSDCCIARGTGLAVGFVGNTSNFIIFCAIMSDLDVVLEIKGPNTICSERITNRSPKKKRPVSPWEYSRPITRSMSCNEEHYSLESEEDDLEDKQISLEYEIVGNKIILRYKPKERGKHQVTILWHGQHVSDSPYSVSVEDPTELVVINNAKHIKSALKSTIESEKNETRKISVRFQNSQRKFTEKKSQFGKILSKRILKYIVKINGKDVPVNAESTESLAAELLKMDYDIETCPSFHRRNSWGFAGDAERKKSVIRQFCVDVNELDAQVCQRRTRSLSINPGPKKILERSDSFDSLASRLKSVKEDVVECTDTIHGNSNEDDYAFISEDLDSQLKNAKDNDDAPRILDSEEGTEQSKSLNDLTENNSRVNFLGRTYSDMDLERISTLSTNLPQEDKVDNPYADSLQNFPSNFNTNHLWEDKEVNEEVIEEQCPRKEIKLNELVFKNQDSDLLKCLKSSTEKKRKKSKKKTIQKVSKYVYVYSRKKFRTKAERKEENVCKNVPKNANSDRNQSDENECMLELKNALSTRVSNNRGNDNLSESHYLEKHTISKQFPQYSEKNSNTVPVTSCDPTEKQSTYNNFTDIRKIYAGSNVGEVKAIESNRAFKNIIKSFENDNSCETVKSTKEVDKHNKYLLHQCSNVKPSLPLIQSEKNMSNTNVGKTKPLRIHTLKTLKEFNFKQFNPPLGSASPVKSQIRLWELSSSGENQNVPSKADYTPETGEVSVKEKLAFWEKTTSLDKNISTESSEIRRNVMANKEYSDSSHVDSNITMNDLQDTASKPGFQGTNVKELQETYLSINKETQETAKKQTDDKMSEELLHYPYKIRVRSFSDPGILDTAKDKEDDVSKSSNFNSSSKEYLYSSNGTTEELRSDEEFGESDSDPIQSSGDEYIDDEIPENAVEYWGDFTAPKGFKLEQYVENYSPWEEEFLQQQYLPVRSYPHACKVFGIAAYYGYVAIKNRFQVFTCGAGFGNLSVSVQGFGQHDVTLVTVVYDRNDVYEVTYQVMTAGYYLILIRWMDKAIPGSPFVCKVTF